MKMLSFNGSLRKNGNTYIAINTVCKQLEKNGIKTEIINIGSYD